MRRTQRYGSCKLTDAGEAYGHYLEIGKWERKQLKKKRAQLTSEERSRQTLMIRIGRMKSGLEEIKILDGMTAHEASELYYLSLQQPLQPKRTRFRPRKGKLEASEIFDQVINSPVTVCNDGELTTAPRMSLVVKRLLANAVRGDIKSADMLITMHAESLKCGDFFPETKYRKR